MSKPGKGQTVEGRRKEEANDGRSSRGLRTRRRIVGHATLLMYDKGYAKTSVDDVIGAAGITKGTFYFHFPSKEELGYAVIENAARHITERVRSVMEGKDSPRERLTAALEEFQRIVAEADCSRGCILGNLALELSNQSEAFREKLAQAFHMMAEVVAGPLEEMKSRGELPEGFDSASFAQFIVSALEGGIMLSKVTRDPAAMRNSVALLLEHFTGPSGKGKGAATAERIRTTGR